jgi:beta-phosphoglucomutase-like phosphatase (HAD superfamily)
MKPGAQFDWDGVVIDSSRQHEESWELLALELGKPLPGVVGLLRTLRDHGVPCAVASSTHRESIETIFDAIGVRAYFAAVVTAEDVSRGKPDPQCRRPRCAGPR